MIEHLVFVPIITIVVVGLMVAITVGAIEFIERRRTNRASRQYRLQTVSRPFLVLIEKSDRTQSQFLDVSGVAWDKKLNDMPHSDDTTSLDSGPLGRAMHVS